MFRVYDTKEKRWIREGVFLSPNDDLNETKKFMFNKSKLFFIPNCRYAVTRDIGTCDKNGTLIYEGDILKSDKNDIVGLVVYIPDKATFVLLDYRKSKFYSLGTGICKDRLVIIGNNFENPELLEATGVADVEQTL